LSLPSFIIGGAQEQDGAPGTSAVPNIVGLGAACQLALDDDNHDTFERLRNRLEDASSQTFRTRVSTAQQIARTFAKHVEHLVRIRRRAKHSHAPGP
jgi:cysteine sulfinate desulfinase/cysteine desulfurase-like protein